VINLLVVNNETEVLTPEVGRVVVFAGVGNRLKAKLPDRSIVQFGGAAPGQGATLDQLDMRSWPLDGNDMPNFSAGNMAFPAANIMRIVADDQNRLWWMRQGGGMSLLSGLRGAQGPQGVPGADGAQGPQGVPGADGAPGPRGAQGFMGVPGEPGPIGPRGAQGDPGEPGGVGLTGNVGPQGLQGIAGPPGPQGLPGVNGAQGAQGPQGTQGPQGAQGPQGVAGVTPTPRIIGTMAAYATATTVALSSPVGQPALPTQAGMFSVYVILTAITANNGYAVGDSLRYSLSMAITAATQPWVLWRTAAGAWNLRTANALPRVLSPTGAEVAIVAANWKLEVLASW
jgi:hypothetical protein